MREGTRRVVLVVLLAISAVALTAVAVGDDLLWSMVRNDHAALLEGASIPGRPGPEAITADLRYLEQEIPRRIPYYGSTVDSAVFVAELHEVLESSDLEGEAGLLAIVRTAALPGAPGIGTGHTKAPILQRPLSRGFYPIVAYLFGDGLWIVHADGRGEDLVGREVLAIGGVPTPDVVELARPYVAADNESGFRADFASMLSHAVFLRGLGLASEDGALRLTLRARDGATLETVLEPVTLGSLRGLAWGRSLQSPVEGASPADPRPERRAFWLEHRMEDGLLYVRINRVRDADDETLAQFGKRVAEEARRAEPNKVIVDLRTNGGGNNQLVIGFVDAVAGEPAMNRRGVLYTLIGRETFSAAGALATALERRTRTLFAGEPSGFTPNHHGDAEAFRLPETSVIVQTSSRYWADGGPYDRRSAIEPDLRVPFDSRHHFEGRDAVVEAVMAHDTPPHQEASLEREWRAKLASSLVGRYRFSPHMVLEIDTKNRGSESGAIAHFSIRGTGLWADSRIYALPDTPDRFGTDITGVFFERDPGGDGLTIDWQGTPHTMPRLPEDFQLPLEHVRAGVSDPASLERGIAAFRELQAAGAMPDSNWEFALNAVGYNLLAADRAEEALTVFELNADLFPTVANVFDSLGEARLAVADSAGAIAALERALEIDAGFTHASELLQSIDSGRSP